MHLLTHEPVPLQHWSEITQAIKYLRRGKQVMSSDDYSPIENLTITRALPLIGRPEVHTHITYIHCCICTQSYKLCYWLIFRPKHFEL